MNRYLFGFMCVLALGVMGCSETVGTGGSGGSAGAGGTGGDGGLGGVAACVDNVCPCTEAGILAAIDEGGGPFTFDCDGPQTVVSQATIELENDVILDGESKLTIDGDESLLIVRDENVMVELLGFTVVNGGGIVNLGTLTMRNCTVSGSRGVSVGTGAIANVGTMTVTGCTISGNSGFSGGGIHNEGTMTVSNSTVSENSADEGGGGGVANLGTMTLTNSTVSGNSDDYGQGDIRNTGTLTVANTLVDGDCFGFGNGIFTSNGYNIESPGNTCGFDQPTDQANVPDPMLGPLQDNGGPTMTHALGAGSVALNVIPAVDCGVARDQRGVSRPQGDACDVGAVEMEMTP